MFNATYLIFAWLCIQACGVKGCVTDQKKIPIPYMQRLQRLVLNTCQSNILHACTDWGLKNDWHVKKLKSIEP